MTSLKNFWQNLSDRDRLVLSFGIIVLVIYLYYLFIYSPLNTAISEKTTQLIEKQETLTWMQKVSREFQSGKVQESITPSQLLTLLGDQLKNTFVGFSYKLEQTGTGDIQLAFEQVPFNDFINWLSNLNEHYALTIKQLTVEKTTTAGLVKVVVFIGTR